MEPKEKSQVLKNVGEFADAQERLVQWGIPFGLLFKSKIALFFFSFLLFLIRKSFRVP